MSEQYKCGLPYNKVDDTLVEDTSFKEETAFEFLASAWLDNHFDVTKCPKAEESKCRLWL